MADTKIEYSDRVWEVTGGCTKCSLGCRGCWAIKEVWRMAHNPLLGDKWQGLVEKKNGVLNWTGKIKCFEDALKIPLRRKKPTTYFVNSKADLFHKEVPNEYRLNVFESIANASQHTYLIFTKRIVEMKDFFQLCEDWDSSEWPNVQLMLSISTQAEADEKIPILLQIPAAVRGLSIEPMLEEIKLPPSAFGYTKVTGEFRTYKNKRQIGFGFDPKSPRINAIVVGGESGKGARPMHPDWPRNIRDQCVAAKVDFYMKQWGEWLPVSQRTKEQCKISTINFWPKRVTDIGDERFFRFGKKKAGCLLDSKEWRQLLERS